MKEYADLLRRRPGVRRAGARPSPRRSATSRSSSSSSARSPPRHPLEMTVAYHDACHLGHAQGVRAAAARAAARHPRPGAARDRRARAVLRLGRHLQHAQPRAGRASSATARPRNIARHRRAAAGHRQPRLPDAGRLRASSGPGTRWGWRTPSRCSTPRSAGCRSARPRRPTILHRPAPQLLTRPAMFDQFKTYSTRSATRSPSQRLCRGPPPARPCSCCSAGCA